MMQKAKQSIIRYIDAFDSANRLDFRKLDAISNIKNTAIQKSIIETFAILDKDTNRNKIKSHKHKRTKPKIKYNNKISPIYKPNQCDEFTLTNWLPKPNKKMKKIETNSWFDAKIYNNNETQKITTRKVQIPIIPEESLKQQNKQIKANINRLKKNKKLAKKKKIIKNIKTNKATYTSKTEAGFIYCEKVRLFPTTKQATILQSWFEACTKMYNVTINYIRKKIYVNGKIDMEKTKTIANFINLRKKLTATKNIIAHSCNPNVPIHIIDESIHEVVNAYKTCF